MQNAVGPCGFAPDEIRPLFVRVANITHFRSYPRTSADVLPFETYLYELQYFNVDSYSGGDYARHMRNCMLRKATERLSACNSSFQLRTRHLSTTIDYVSGQLT